MNVISSCEEPQSARQKKKSCLRPWKVIYFSTTKCFILSPTGASVHVNVCSDHLSNFCGRFDFNTSKNCM